jgi:outer membrane protein assembly factor BamB
LLATQIVGCAFLEKNPPPKKFSFVRSWARQTTSENFYGYRVRHQMAPLLFENMIIQGNGIDGIAAYDKTSGHLVWKKNIPGGVEIGVALDKGNIFFGANDGFFYSLKANSGAVNWSFPLRAEGLGKPIIQNGAVYFIAGNNAAYALKSETGEQMWLYNRNDAASLTVRGGAEPTYLNGQVLFGFSDGYIVALDAARGVVAWEKQLGAGARFKDVDSKPVVDGDRIFVSNYDGNLYCLNAKDGKTLWSFEEGGYTPVTVLNDVVYYSTSTSAVVALDRTSGKLMWRKALAGSIASQPIYHKGLIIYGEWEGQLRAVDARSGADVAGYATGRGVTSTPVLDEKNNMAYVMSIDANLFAFHMGYHSAGEVWPWE